MVDEKISDFTSVGAIQATDLVCIVRDGDNATAEVGTMAIEDSTDYYTKTEVDAAINNAPGIASVTAGFTLDGTTHNGAEIYLRPHTGSPSGYIVTLPYNLPVNFRCSFINLCNATEVQIKPATGSPNDTLNGAVNVSAKFLTKYAGAYLRKTATGELIIVGAVDVS